MGYYIAVASSDGKAVDLSFGEAEEFLIYEINGKSIKAPYARHCVEKQNSDTENICGCGIHGGNHNARVELLSDCRCVLCGKIGPQARKLLERKQISVFDIEADLIDALQKVIDYFDKIDNHKNLYANFRR